MTGEYEAALACLVRAALGAAFEYADAHLAEPNCAPGLRSAVLVRPKLSRCIGCTDGAHLYTHYYIVGMRCLPRLQPAAMACQHRSCQDGTLFHICQGNHNMHCP